MLLESHCDSIGDVHYPLPLVEAHESTSVVHGPRLWLDPAPLIRAVAEDARAGVGRAAIATKFHAALMMCVMEVASRTDADCTVLSGGCFQNRALTEACVSALQKKGQRAVIHRNLPPNDGGLSLGQALVARAAHQRFSISE
jgi:hydrogenase maturation protein HypF